MSRNRESLKRFREEEAEMTRLREIRHTDPARRSPGLRNSRREAVKQGGKTKLYTLCFLC